MSRATRDVQLRAYAVALGGVALATSIGTLAATQISLADQAMLYLPAILLAGLGGRGASLFAAALSVAAYDFFFVPPRFTFAVSDARSWITFLVMFAVGTAIGSLVARLRRAEDEARERERATAALLAFTRDAAAAGDVGGVAAAVESHVRDVTGVAATVRIPDTERPVTGPIAVELAPGAALAAEQRAFVEAVAQQAGVAIGRLQLAATAREAELRAKAEALRNALLSSVSHDLRTPLAVITGMATTLRDADVLAAREHKDALDTIIDEVQRLSRVLTNVLSITKVESGAAPRREWVPLEELVGSALVRLEDELAGHPVVVDVPEAALANVDPILAEQLLINLIENAAKHTPAGTPIEVHVARQADRAVIEVSDRGPGVPANAQGRLFEKFFRGPTRAAGAGLGLAVCRGIVIAHHGIEARTRDGGGASFVAWFPDEGTPPELSELAS